MDDRDAAEQIEKILSSNAAKAFSAAYRRFSEDFDAKNLGTVVASFFPADETDTSAESEDWAGHAEECSVRSNGIVCSCGKGPYSYPPPEGMFSTPAAPPQEGPKPTPVSTPNLQNDWFRIMDSVPGDLLNLVRQAEQYSRLVEVAKLASDVAGKFSTPEKTTLVPSAATSAAAPASYVGEAYLAGREAEKTRIITQLEEARRQREKKNPDGLSKKEKKAWDLAIATARNSS